jgi:putative transposase
VELSARQLIGWLGLGTSRFYNWKYHYGKVNEHNGMVPRDWWLEDWEKRAIVDYHERHPLEGYRRLTFMMLDDDVVAVSPASVYRVLKQANRLYHRRFLLSKKGTSFVQPLVLHEHWHVDVCYINVSGTFYYLTSVLNGCSRYIVHWEIRESMTERDVETIVQRALERHLGEEPWIISDNGPQFIARDFKEFIRLTGVRHVRTSPYYPQSNGKLERWHGSLKRECIRPAAASLFDEARRRISSYVDHYNNARLHSALGYVTPVDKLIGLEKEIYAERDRKPEEARLSRATARRGLREVA